MVEEPQVLRGELLSPDERFYFEARNRAVEGSVGRVNDALGRLVTLSTAMSGGALVLLKEDLCNIWFRVVAAGCFFLALALAIVGSVPAGEWLGHSPQTIEDALARTAAAKKRWVWASSACLLAGLFVAIVGAAARAAW